MSTSLSVNLNKIALVRNSRPLSLNLPNLDSLAEVCLAAGAHGLTVHPRPDERHIRADDVAPLAQLIRRWPGREYNIEGNPFHNLMDHVQAVRPHQATFVPDAMGQVTSDHGWDLQVDGPRLKPLIDKAPYARAHGTSQHAEVLAQYREASLAALALGLEVNAGHDLNLHNLGEFLSTVPGVVEVSIGHALLADALLMGYEQAIKAYLAVIAKSYA